MVSLTQVMVIIAFCNLWCNLSLVTSTNPIDLTPIRHGGPESCITKKNMKGICVHESVCNEEHTIIPGGVVDESDFRQKQQCSSREFWCCTSDNVIPPPQIESTLSDNCLAPETDVCPWCVLLYKALDEKTLAHRPFCLGALIGSKVIITASTCLKAAQKKVLYAQVPNSANPGKNYTVDRQLFHPKYNSGAHAYDFGIAVIDNHVTFEKGKSRGACIDFKNSSKPSEDEICVGYGFDNKGKITSTLMTVKKKSCGISGSSMDAACGESLDRVCIVNEGGPILCQTKEIQGLYLIGIARTTCDKDDKVTLGSIIHSKDWMEAELASMNIDKDKYT